MAAAKRISLTDEKGQKVSLGEILDQYSDKQDSKLSKMMEEKLAKIVDQTINAALEPVNKRLDSLEAHKSLDSKGSRAASKDSVSRKPGSRAASKDSVSRKPDSRAASKDSVSRKPDSVLGKPSQSMAGTNESQHIVFVRQGQASSSNSRQLAKVAQEQAQALRDDSRLRGAELVVVSPMVLAVQTAVQIFGKDPPNGRYRIEALLGERKNASGGANRLPVRGPQKGELVNLHANIETWDGFEEMQEDWQKTNTYHHVRVEKIRKWLATRPERNIVLVAHNEFFQCLSHMENRLGSCEVCELTEEWMAPPKQVEVATAKPVEPWKDEKSWQPKSFLPIRLCLGSLGNICFA